MDFVLMTLLKKMKVCKCFRTLKLATKIFSLTQKVKIGSISFCIIRQTGNSNIF